MVCGSWQLHDGSVNFGQLHLLRGPEVQRRLPEPDELGPGHREGDGQGRREVHLQPGDISQTVSDGLPAS